MADNTELDLGSGGDVIASDDISGVKYQRVKLIHGADGVNAGDVADGNPLPIDDAGGTLTIDSTQLPAALAAGGGLKVEGVAGGVAVPVSAASLPLPSGAATEAKQDTANTSLTSIDGKITAVNTGAVVVSSSALPSGAATSANQSTANTALAAIQTAAELIDDAVAAEDTALGKGVLLQGDDGTDRKNVAVDTDGNVQADVVGALPAGDNNIGNVDVVTLPALPAGTNNIGDVDILTIAAGDNNIGNVDIVTMPNVTLAAGTNTNEVVGDAAHGAAVAGNPVLVGLEGRSTAPTAVDDGDVVRALASLLGKLVILPYAIPASTWSYASANGGVTDTADDEAKAAVASTRHYITSVQVINAHDTVGTEVVIKDGSTVLWRGWAEQTGGGVSAKFDPPLRGTANTAVNVANITTGSQTYFNLQGFSATE